MPGEDFRETVATAKALAMGIAALMLGLQLATWVGFVRIIRDGHADFRAYYSAGYQVRTGNRENIYDYESEKTVQDATVSHETVAMLYIHPSYEALFFAPFSALPYRWAFVAFLIVNLGLLAFAAFMLQSRFSNLGRIWPTMLPVLLFCFLGTGESLMQGQDSLILLAVLASVALLLGSRRDFWAGAALAFGLFRFQFILPIAILFLLWKNWRLFAGFAWVGVAIAALSVALTGLNASETYINTLLALSAGKEGAYHQPLWLMPTLRGLVNGLLSHSISAAGIRSISIIVTAMILTWLGSKRPKAAQFEIAIVAAAFLSYHLLVHDLTALLIPILFSVDTLAGRIGVRSTARYSSGWIGIAIYVVPAALIFGTHYFYLVSMLIFAYLVALVEEPPNQDFRVAVAERKLMALKAQD